MDEDSQREIKRLKRLLRESNRDKERAENRAQQFENEKHSLEAETRHTTITEYIKACHKNLFLKLSVQQNRLLTPKGTTTNPKGKLCPNRLSRWHDFLTEQQTHHHRLFGHFPVNDRLFDSQHWVSVLGNKVSASPIANEKMLEMFMHFAVEDPVRCIVDRLRANNIPGDPYRIGRGVIFENHPSAISDVALETDDRTAPPQTPQRSALSQRLKPDQICVYRNINENAIMEERNLLLIEEYKAPHKLTVEHLRVGLKEDMDILGEIVNNPKIPTNQDPPAYFQYCAKQLTAAALTQTYTYMIEGGVSYGILTNGEATVFLKVDWNRDPTTLLYHLAEPKYEVLAHTDGIISCTAVSQYLSFILLALSEQDQLRQRNQDNRHMVKSILKKWAYDFDAILLSMSPEGKTPPDSDVTYVQPETYPNVDRSPYPFRHPRRLNTNDEPRYQPARGRTPEPSDDESGNAGPNSSSPAERRARVRERATSACGTQGRQTTVQSREATSGGDSTRGVQYCTQKCLIGLVNGDFLDMQCPNVHLHRETPCGMMITHHPVNHATWLRLLREQWEKSLDAGITSLHISGASGALFRVTLLAYGYTFIGKGTPEPLIKYLRREAAVYKRLKHMQGTSVPVFLGTVDLRPMDKIYYYEHRVYIVHVTFFSWGGLTLFDLELPDGLGRRLMDEACDSLQSMHDKGVIHGDVRKPNMLYNPHTKRIMFIDFDSATIVESGHEHGQTRTTDCRRQQMIDAAFQREVVAAEWILSNMRSCRVK